MSANICQRDLWAVLPDVERQHKQIWLNYPFNPLGPKLYLREHPIQRMPIVPVHAAFGLLTYTEYYITFPVFLYNRLTVWALQATFLQKYLKLYPEMYNIVCLPFWIKKKAVSIMRALCAAHLISHLDQQETTEASLKLTFGGCDSSAPTAALSITRQERYECDRSVMRDKP